MEGEHGVTRHSVVEKVGGRAQRLYSQTVHIHTHTIPLPLSLIALTWKDWTRLSNGVVGKGEKDAAQTRT
ncbi:hypothetical protein BLNAU_8015 [Blattamonas nauphoetae]|uniref:Uncharacterized protein n=1 Tax=Blattamonas nauphoetae TaxID=2049346 RepID=A0ABQ9XZN9_9EUKA|nr:hypothetical protein BLNAU_8015 [Blattamonas nauphoetae]